MTVQILPDVRKKSFGEKIGQALHAAGESGGQSIVQHYHSQEEKRRMQQENDMLAQLTGMDFHGITDPNVRQEAVKQALMGKNKEREIGLQQQGKESLISKKQEFLNQILGGGQGQADIMNGQGQSETTSGQGMPQNQDQMNGQQFNPLNISDAAIAQASAVDPNIGRSLRDAKDAAMRQKTASDKAKRSQFESERSYHTGFSKEANKEADVLRASIPKKEMALNFARNAIQTGDLSYLSPDKLADATGIDLFRTSKGAQLTTAGKENLLSNMSKVSGKAQNMWFEQRLNSMFPKIGQSNEANLTVQEMLEGEVALDKAYLEEYDRLVKQDEATYGFEKKDISQRARNNIKPLEKEILKRTTYRMKEIEEVEKGLQKLKPMVGKNVSKGTPLTLAMAKLYKDKFGNTALDVAKKNGYYIPTIEEFRVFEQEPQEFREEFSE